MIRHFLPCLAAAMLALSGCDDRQARGPLAVSVIGTAPELVDPSRTPIDPPAAALLSATAQGLVALDASGQIEPALAERWIVSDDGRSFIFRLSEARWPDGRRVTAEDAAAALRKMVRPTSRNPLKPLLGAVAEITAVTPQVVEIELSAPRPNLLQLLAQPEMAILSAKGGSGPYRLVGRTGARVTLRPIPDPDADPEAAPAPADLRLYGERASLAVARFARGGTQAVLGGSFADLGIVVAAGLPEQPLRFDPVDGLFGLVFAVRQDGFTADPANRRALAQAIDRDALAGAVAPAIWAPRASIVPGGVADLPAPAQPEWLALPIAARRREAAARVVIWASGEQASPHLRVAMPSGARARLLFAHIAADWRRIGVSAEAVAPGDPAADLVLIDAVAPSDTAAFYLRRFACAAAVPCTPEGDAALTAARVAPTLDARSRLLAEADRLITADTPFIALGAPARWSLVAPSLDQWRASPRGRHPLRWLRAVRR